MSNDRFAHLDDATLLRDLAHLAAQDRVTTAALLAHIAEVDARRLYLPAAYSSMFAYCVGELGFSEDAAAKRIQAARAARNFPRLFADVAEGRLHLAAVCLLAPHLAAANVDELVAAATHRRKADIEAWLASRFAPAAGVSGPPARVTVLRARARVDAAAATAAPTAGPTLAFDTSPDSAECVASSPAASAVMSNQHAPGHVLPHAPARFLVQIPIDEATHAKLRHAQALLGHAVPNGDLAGVLDRALDALLSALLKQKAALISRPRSGEVRPGAAAPRPTDPRSRTIPAAVRRAVWGRDAGQCTFTSSEGRRCASRRALEFDHVVPFARGGEATLAGVRLRCRAHNQYEAERAFGTKFMQRKRERGAAAPARSPEEQAVHDRGVDGVGAARSSSACPPEEGPR